jgi:hypothetical protein
MNNTAMADFGMGWASFVAKGVPEHQPLIGGSGDCVSIGGDAQGTHAEVLPFESIGCRADPFSGRSLVNIDGGLHESADGDPSIVGQEHDVPTRAFVPLTLDVRSPPQSLGVPGDQQAGHAGRDPPPRTLLPVSGQEHTRLRIRHPRGAAGRRQSRYRERCFRIRTAAPRRTRPRH